ncbi:diaminobutyrate acetyltransferase [Verticiella sediminum]|uniref:L-2,4-diaminobutyric acid acetyltransferase n=1 Tax=Verticiella sediminum TaxID=1247510 RepID=A0A556AVV5_9BURK|nr:diaminobutyrate acetyltransferase [Verticiella sediminum]TSH97057.1 diaminobutyrate acetyltransferase [Verticiella sediminum]
MSNENAKAQPNEDIVLRAPRVEDGAAVAELIRQSPPLDVNSTYAYLLLCHHFAGTCVVAELEGRVVGFISGYLPPEQPETFFVWQVAVHADARGRGLGQSMLRHLLQRPVSRHVHFLETTVSPSNAASRGMFSGLAKDLETDMSEQPLFDHTMFGEGAAHEDEMLLKIGPFH